MFVAGIVDATVPAPPATAFFLATTQIMMTTIRMNAIPPTSPPASAPLLTFEDVFGLLLDVVVVVVVEVWVKGQKPLGSGTPSKQELQNKFVWVIGDPYSHLAQLFGHESQLL